MDKKKKLFAEAKIKLVMKVYGLSRRRAVELIARREAADGTSPEHAAAKPHKASGIQRDCGDGEELITAEEFFGEL